MSIELNHIQDNASSTEVMKKQQDWGNSSYHSHKTEAIIVQQDKID